MRSVPPCLKQTLNESIEARLEAPPLSPEVREELLYTHATAFVEATQDLAEGRHRKLENIVELVLDDAGINLPRSLLNGCGSATSY